MRLDGYYINLDRSVERRQLFEEQLDSLDLAEWIRRFPAVDGQVAGPYEAKLDNNVWACRRSHELIIQQADPETVTAIFEDDAEISRYFSSTITESNMQSFIERTPTADIVFLDCAMYWLKAPLLLAAAERHLNINDVELNGDGGSRQFSGVDILDTKGIYAYCAAAYLVTPRGKRTLLRLIYDVREQPDVPIDRLYLRWIETGELSCSLLVPFLATPRFEMPSTITSNENLSQTVDPEEYLWVNVLRRLLFAGNTTLDLPALEALTTVNATSSEYRLGMRVYETFRQDF
jgi:GR25 family glycosyltransferase involved in LPS biosynthesis